MRSGGEGPPKRPYTSAAFAEQRPLGNSTAAADASTQCVFEQLRRGRNSEHVHPARRHAPSARARAITVPSFTLGIEFMLRLLDVETLLGRRHASLGFHSAI